MSSLINASNEYLTLVKRFPLRPIRSEAVLDLASDFYGELVLKGEKRTQDEEDYLTILGKLIREYEDHLAPLAKPMTPQRALKSFMEDNGLTQSVLARKIGVPQSVISESLSGKRGFSKVLIVKLARYFKVAPGLFLPRSMKLVK